MPGSAHRLIMPAPGDAAAPACAVLRVPGIGGLRLLHATRGDREPPQPGRQPHRHDLWHCVAYAAGAGSCSLDGAVVPVRAPFLVLTSPGQPHSFSRLPGEDAVYHEMTFAPERPGAVPAWPALLAAWTGTDCPLPASAPCSAACADDVGSLAGRVAAVVEAGHPQAAVLLQGLLAELLFTLFRHLVADAERAAPADAMETARRFIERHAEEAIDLAAVARAAGLSAKHLGRAFAARYGQPPMRWRRNELMRRAAVLLRTSDAPVEAIAARLGFADWRHFSRCFRAAHGRPPASYRRG